MASSSASGQIRSQPENTFDGLGPYSAPKSTEPRDIFINHRGCDVKYRLATDIYNKLHSMGFSVFLDVEALQVGDSFPAEVQHAMATATLHIAIFSPNYAQLPWCLAELTFMLKTGAQLIPIFYHVDPSDLRYIEQGKGVYADAFSKHDKDGRYTIEKLLEWKRALNDCSYRQGYAVKNSRDEATVLKNIVNNALRITKRKGLVSVAEHPVGLDELVQEFESLAVEERVKIRGIVGMGGSGKTTLAKEIFDRNFSSFERRGFVFDVRDAATKNALPGKQKKLLKDLGVHHFPFDHVDEGKAILEKWLSAHRALIVLDDVDHIHQLDAFVANKDKLGSRSMVIVTTRELGVLLSWGLSDSCTYRMPRLDKSHAEQLFCRRAFLQPFPPPVYQILVEDFLKACSGLPLSLKVLGAQLYGKPKDYWISQLHKISRILPTEIKQRLQVTYDALDEEEKEMFLDVACFLIGEDKNRAIAVWDGSDWSGLHGLETLVMFELVEMVREEEIDGEERVELLRMHDQVRDMGREIASRHTPYRLWSPLQIRNMMVHSKKRNPVRGILPADSFVAFKEYTQLLTGQAIRRPKRLRFSYGLQILSVKGNEFTEEFASLSEDLVWLRWEDFPLRNLPSWLSLKKLSVLELHAANELEELWQENIADPPLQLRELILNACLKLQRLPRSIGYLGNLQRLDIDFHGSSLSQEFCLLRSLVYLRLKSPVLFSLPSRFGDLMKLKIITLRCCKQLSMLPDSFSRLIRLTHLDLSYCEMLSSLPDGFGNLVSLKVLNMSFCKQLSRLPDSLSQLIHLEVLTFVDCEMLSSLIETLPLSLKSLGIYSCNLLKNIKCISGLKNLETLEICDCLQIEDLPSFAGLTSMNRFKMRNCPKIEKLEGLEPAQSSKMESFSYYFYD